MAATIKYPIDIPASEGDYDFDNLLGRELATRLIDEARLDSNVIDLHYAILSMAKKDRCSGVEVGFVAALCEAVL